MFEVVSKDLIEEVEVVLGVTISIGKVGGGGSG